MFLVELVLEKLDLENLLQQETARLDKLEARRKECDASTKDDPPDVPACQERAPDTTNLFSQRISDILTGIRKKKDKDICEAASLNEKRKKKPDTTQKRKMRRILEDDDDDEGDRGNVSERLDVIEEREEPEEVGEASNVRLLEPGKRKNVLEDIKECDENNSVKTENEASVIPEKSPSMKKLDIDVCLDSIKERRSEPEKRKQYQSTLEKLQVFKKPLACGNQKKDGENERKFDSVPILCSTPVTNLPNCCVMSEVEVSPIKPAAVESQDSGKGDSELQNLNHIATNSAIKNNQHLSPVLPSVAVSQTCELTSEMSLHSESLPTSTAADNFQCSLSLNLDINEQSSQLNKRCRETVLVPTPLLTPHNQPKGYDRQKLMALARLGKKLSQSRSQRLGNSQSTQSCQGNSTQSSQKTSSVNYQKSALEKCQPAREIPPKCVPGSAQNGETSGSDGSAGSAECSRGPASQSQSSQFSLHEMSWDDLELEL